MVLGQYFDILRRRWLSVLIPVFLALALASVVIFTTPATYTATTRLFFSVTGESASDLAQGSTFAQRQMSSYTQVATSRMVLEPVVRRLALPLTPSELAKSVKATVPLDTVILEIAATDRDPRRAAEIADAVGAELSTAAGQLTSGRQDGSAAVQVTTIEAAQVPDRPSQNFLLILGVGLVLGLMVGICIALLRSMMDNTVRSSKEIRGLTDIPILGSFQSDRKISQHPVILQHEPDAAPAAAMRRLRANFQVATVAKPMKSIVITSSIPREGKSTIAINLAASLADTGARVILIDADLRRSSIARYTGMEGCIGLTTVLIGQAKIQDVIRPLGNSSLDVMAAGQPPPNPSELLASPAMATLLETLLASYDIVLIDSPALLPVSDAALLSNIAGGALLVAGADRLQQPQLREALAYLQAAGTHVYGIIMNKLNHIEAGTSLYESSYPPPEKSQIGDSFQPMHSGVGQLSADAEPAPQLQRESRLQSRHSRR